jgi:hypothetical protein
MCQAYHKIFLYIARQRLNVSLTQGDVQKALISKNALKAPSKRCPQKILPTPDFLVERGSTSKGTRAAAYQVRISENDEDSCKMASLRLLVLANPRGRT